MVDNPKNKFLYVTVFTILNGVLLFLLTLRYSNYINLSGIETVSYFLLAVLGNSFLIVFVIYLFLFLPLILLKLPKKMLSFWLVFVASIGIVTLLLDYEVYSQYRIHLNAIIIKMAVSAGDEIFHFSWFTWVVSILSVIITIAIEYFIYRISVKVSKSYNFSKKSKILFFSVWILIMFYSHFTHAKADLTIYRPVTSIARHIPLYYPLTMKRFLTKYKLVDLNEIQNRQNFKLGDNETEVINYPKHELKFDESKDSLNIAIIVLDCWRFDMLTEETTPNIYKFSKGESIQKFNKHYSGGNGTRIGLFSLFYGLYGTYWNTMSDEQISPVMMDEIVKRNYHIGVFASSTLTIPPFNRTIFKSVSNLRTGSKGSSASEKDLNALDDWKKFMLNLGKDKPFFSFLFFDSIHAYDIPQDYPKIFQPYWERVDHVKLNNNFDPVPYRNRYKTSAHFVDSMVGDVLELLSEKDVLKNTVVIITGDHGEEFNENKKNYWGHGGNYIKYQVQVPLIIYFPKMQSKEYDYWTNHTDLVPTIMENVFKVKNPSSDYSNGKSLFVNSNRSWMVSGGYFNYAILEKDVITLSFPSGAYEIQDYNCNVVDKDLNYKVFKEVLEATTSFYK